MMSGGTSFEDKTVNIRSATQASHTTYTWVNVTGSGLLLGVVTISGNEVRVQLDGGSIYQMTTNNTSGAQYWPMFLKFTGALKVSSAGSTTGQAFAVYLLD
jgi:hypothetical protein